MINLAGFPFTLVLSGIDLDRILLSLIMLPLPMVIPPYTRQLSQIVTKLPTFDKFEFFISKPIVTEEPIVQLFPIDSAPIITLPLI